MKKILLPALLALILLTGCANWVQTDRKVCHVMFWLVFFLRHE